MLPFILNKLVNSLSSPQKLKEKITWVLDEPTPDDMNHIKKSTEDSFFDKQKLRSHMLEELQKGNAVLLCKKCKYAKVIVIAYPHSIPAIPWTLWGSVVSSFGPRKVPWRILWFANPTPKELPNLQFINSGYTIPCTPNQVVIYREEESTRVLIHELLHAACTDNPLHDDSTRESLTEVWAELFLIALCANGSKQKAMALWKSQSQWISNQHFLLTTQYGVKDSSVPSWRYTVARKGIFESMGFSFPRPRGLAAQGSSLSFVCPELQ